MKKYDITAFGEILIDFTYVGNSNEGQKLFAQNAGGAPANVLVSATKFGLNTSFLGKIGDDMHGEFLKNTLQTEKVNTDGLIIDKDYFTTLAFVDLNEKGERSFSFARKHGADTFMTKDDINLEILKESKVFHIGSLSLTTDLGKETTLYALEKAKEYGAFISYDPNYRASLWDNEEAAKKEMRELIKYADFMKISEEECELLTGDSDPYIACEVLNSYGVKVVCVTLGENGVVVGVNGCSKQVYGYTPLKVTDTTGAGDSFWGGFLTEIIKNDINNITFDKALSYADFANATASLCVEQSGAIRAMPTLSKVKQRIMSAK